ncbi:MAG: type I 3-dehydroquinate dehydratase [Candidatus Geothermarchaeales archaeon]
MVYLPGFKLCLSIGGDTPGEVGVKLREAQGLGADLIEVRVDYLREMNLETLEDILKPYLNRCILTCRSREEGGKFRGDEGERATVLENLIGLSPAYIDLELSAVKSEGHLIRAAREEGVSVITSWHDFQGTPGVSTLRAKASEVLKIGQIGKIVTRANSISDNVRVLRLYGKPQDGRLVAFAMGHMGVVSRVLAPILGSPIAYVSLPLEGTAPGQLSIDELRGFLDVLKALG